VTHDRMMRINSRLLRNRLEHRQGNMSPVRLSAPQPGRLLREHLATITENDKSDAYIATAEADARVNASSACARTATDDRDAYGAKSLRRCRRATIGAAACAARPIVEPVIVIGVP
jgi:hypothetical protein